MKYIFTIDDMRQAFKDGLNNTWESTFEEELKALKIVRNKQAQQIWRGKE